MMNIVILDYGGGNLGSVARLMTSLGADFAISSDPVVIAQANIVVLPGQGAISQAMHRLRGLGLAEVLCERARLNRPLLGICLGMQLLVDWSDEDGGQAGLGIMSGKVVRFSPDLGLKIPHMGWNQLVLERDDYGYFSGIEMPSYAYFAHSYYVEGIDPQFVVTSTTYGVTFPSVIASGAVLGIQPHPEKSSEVGVQIIRNYLDKWL